MHVEAYRAQAAYAAERMRPGGRVQGSEATRTAEFPRPTEALRAPQATEPASGPGGGSPTPPPSRIGGGHPPSGEPPQLVAARPGDPGNTLVVEPGRDQSRGGAQWHRIDNSDLPTGLQRLVEVQAMSHPEVMGRGGRLDLVV